MEKSSSHARSAIPWLQTLVDVSHGQISLGTGLFVGTEGYTRFVAPRLENWLMKNSYLNNLFGDSFSRFLRRTVSTGPGMVLGLVPVGDGIAKMSKYPPGSPEFKEGSLELGTGIGFFLSSLIPSPIGLFTDLVLIAVSTLEEGETAIERLEHDSHIVLEKTFLNRFLMGLGIIPVNFQSALQQAELEKRVSDHAESLFTELESHYQNATAENHPPRIPVMIYTWPIYEGQSPLRFFLTRRLPSFAKKISRSY